MRTILLALASLLALVGAVQADGLTPVGDGSSGRCYLAGSRGPTAACTLQGTTWVLQLGGGHGGTVSASPLNLTGAGPAGLADQGPVGGRALPSIISPATYQMPPPSEDAAMDAANFAAAQASGAQTIALQAGTYLMPPAGYAPLRSNQNLVGQGSSVTTISIIGQGTGRGMLYGDSPQNIVLRGFTLDYKDHPALTPGYSGGILSLVSPKNITIEDVNLIGWPITGMDTSRGSDVTYRGGLLRKSANPRGPTGVPMPVGSRTQCINVAAPDTSSVGQRYRFENVTCQGAGFDVAAADVDYVNTTVVGWTFGAAYTTENFSGVERHRFRHVRASGGRTGAVQRTVIDAYGNVVTENGGPKVVEAGHDDNRTSALCWELWPPNSIIENSSCDDAGGDAIALGAQNSRISNNTFSRLGMQRASDGIVARNYPINDRSANGSIISGNTIAKSAGDGLKAPYYPIDLSASVVVRLIGNNFGTQPMSRKGAGDKWRPPGMLIGGDSRGYGHAPCTTQSPLGITVQGVQRTTDILTDVTFVGKRGEALPSGLRAYAEVYGDNTIYFYLQDLACGRKPVRVPAGTFSARLITID